MPAFDDRGRLLSISDEERCALPGDLPEIVALYAHLPVAGRQAAWRTLWREQKALHPEWNQYDCRDLDLYLCWIFTDHTVAELARFRAEAAALEELDVLPNLTRNCLVRNDIRSGAQVRATPDAELLSLRNFGKTNLRYTRQHFPYQSEPE